MIKSNPLKDFLIAFGIAIALLVLSETGLRMLYPENFSPQLPKQEVAYKFNKDYLISLKPNLRNNFIRSKENGGEIIKWETNSLSFRGKELQLNPDVRIIVYGDSNIQAEFSLLENTFCYRLEKYLNTLLSGKKVEVLNSGISGAGPDQSFIKFSGEADTLKPDLVIFNIFADNDYGDIIRNRLFELDGDGNLVSTNFKKEEDRLLIENRKGENNKKDKNLLLSLLIVREVNKIIKRVSDKLRHKPSQQPIDMVKSLVEEENAIFIQRKPRTFSHFNDFYDLDVAVDPNSRSSKIKIKLMEAVLKEINKAAKAKGIELLILIQPSAIDLTNNFMFSYVDLQKYQDYKRTNLTNPVEKMSIDHHLYRLNLFDIFMDNNPEGLYFRNDDDHWNDKGQDLAAKAAAAYISNNMLKDSR